MPVPYNLLPMEMLVAMSTAEAQNAPKYLDAARMWREVDVWINEARGVLRSGTGELRPVWQDIAGTAFAADIDLDDTELAGWTSRINASQVWGPLTTLAGAITRTNAEVLALAAQYEATRWNPLTAWAAVGFHQAAGAVMTALGAEFEMTAGTIAAAAGIKRPDLPTVEIKPSADGNSAEDAIEALTATADALTEVEGLASSLGLGGTGGGISGFDPADYAGGSPSLAGLDTALPSGTTANLTSAAPGAGTAPTLSGMGLPYGTLGAGVGLPGTAKPLAAKRAPVAAAEVSAALRAPVGAATAPPGAVPPPMMPGMAGQQAGAARTTGTAPTGRARTTRRRGDASEAVPVDLRGRGAQ